MQNVAIIAGIRTPFGRAIKGAFQKTRPEDLGIEVTKQLLKTTGIAPDEVEDFIIGCAMPEGPQGLNMARAILLGAGLPVEVPGMIVNRFCASGLQSIAILADRISTGQMSLGISGGVESMSMVPMTGFALSLNKTLVEQMPAIYIPMGITAENVAKKFGITRQEQDSFSLESHMRAIAAQKAGFFDGEIVPTKAIQFTVPGQKKETIVAMDECPREDTSLEKLAQLPLAFDKQGSVTAGNSSPLTDGAALALLMSAPLAAQKGLSPLGFFRSFVVSGVPPEIMGIGPVSAVNKLLLKTGLSMKDIDVVELNEAFASQALYCARELKIPREKLNPNGGAIALGHPLGVSGTRMAITALRELKRRKGRYAIVTMCVGGGMGAAALLEAAY